MLDARCPLAQRTLSKVWERTKRAECALEAKIV